ncbi:MAG TPA: hypothetical protein VJA66_17295 [Thermoanaerobaculia bacterium]
MRKLFTLGDIAESDEHDLTGNSDIRIARVIAEDHRPIALVLRGRADKEVISDLNLGGTKPRLKLKKAAPIDDAPALDGHDLTRGDWGGREQPATVNRALSYGRLGRTV